MQDGTSLDQRVQHSTRKEGKRPPRNGNTVRLEDAWFGGTVKVE